jgi:hypothetical protein
MHGKARFRNSSANAPIFFFSPDYKRNMLSTGLLFNFHGDVLMPFCH